MISQKQFIPAENTFLKQNNYSSCYWMPEIYQIGIIKIPTGTINWDVETYRNK